MHSMRRVLGFGLIGVLLIGGWLPARASVRCGKPSKCSDAAVVAAVRSAVAAACPCTSATSSGAFAKCWRPVVKAQAQLLGKVGFPAACRADVKRALSNSTCGRADAALCREISRKGVETCRVEKTVRCADPYERVVSSCENACACSAAKTDPRSVGCDYFATSMDVFEHGDCFAAYVVNASPTAAHIAVRYDGTDLPAESFTRIPAGSAATLSAYDPSLGLPPGGAAVLFLGGGSGDPPLCPVASAVPISSFADTGIFKSFEITTDVPVVAYQINPYGGGAREHHGIVAAAADERLGHQLRRRRGILPGRASGGTPNRTSSARRSTSSRAKTTPSRRSFRSSSSPAAAEFRRATPASRSRSISMKGEHAQITQNAELTGSVITANKPIGLMAGHPCMNVPIGTPLLRSRRADDPAGARARQRVRRRDVSAARRRRDRNGLARGRRGRRHAAHLLDPRRRPADLERGQIGAVPDRRRPSSCRARTSITRSCCSRT